MIAAISNHELGCGICPRCGSVDVVCHDAVPRHECAECGDAWDSVYTEVVYA